MKVHKFVIVTSFYHDEEAFHFQSHESLRRLSILANDQLRLCIPVVQGFEDTLVLQTNCCFAWKSPLILNQSFFTSLNENDDYAYQGVLIFFHLIMCDLHDVRFAAYPGFTKLYEDIRKLLYWPKV